MASLRLSASLNELDKLACRIPVSPYYFSSTILGLLPSHTASLHPAVAALYSQLALAKRQISVLESKDASLREEVDGLRLTVRFLLAEIAVLQAALEYAKDHKRTSLLAGSDRERISRLENRLANYQRFIRALAEGRVLDPRIIDPAQARLEHGHEPESAIVEAIQDAARDKDSPWSKILPTLKSGTLNNYLAAINLLLKTRQDLHDVERLAHFWKDQARSLSSHRAGIISSGIRVAEVTRCAGDAENLQPGHSSCGASDLPAHDGASNDATSTSESPNFYAASPPLLVPVPSENLKTGSPLDLDRNKSSFHLLRSSHSDGSKAPTKSVSTRSKIHAKHARRTTFHVSTNRDTQVTEKRYGFIMPCIKSVLNKHTSAPAKAHSFLDGPSPDHRADTVGPVTVPSSHGPNRVDTDATRPISLRITRVLQSVERLCATLSSGSLGSLEASNTDTSADDPQLLKNMPAIDDPTLVDLVVPDLNQNPRTEATKNAETAGGIKRASNHEPASYSPGDKTVVLDLTVTASTPSRQHKVSAEAPMYVTMRSTKKQEPMLSLVGATTLRARNSLVKQTAQREVRTCRGTVSTYFPKTSCTLASETRPPSLTLVRIQHAKTLGCVNDTRDLASVSEAPCPPVLQLLAATVAPANSTCTSKLRLGSNFTPKSVPAKPVVPVKSVNATNCVSTPPPQPCLQKHSELSITIAALPRVPPDADITSNDRVPETPTSTAKETVLIPKPRGRLRVANRGIQPIPRKPVRPPLLPTQKRSYNTALLQTTPSKPAGIRDPHARLVSCNGGKAVGSVSGTVGGVGGASSHKAHTQGRTVKIERRSRDKKP